MLLREAAILVSFINCVPIALLATTSTCRSIAIAITGITGTVSVGSPSPAVRAEYGLACCAVRKLITRVARDCPLPITRTQAYVTISRRSRKPTCRAHCPI